MPLPDVKESWSSRINTVTLGATRAEGGTRGQVVQVGGANSLPFLHFEGQTLHRPAIALEVLDRTPDDWPEVLTKAFHGVLNDPVEWAKLAVEEAGADLVCLRLQSIHPDFGDASPQQAAQTVSAVAQAVSVPLIVWGCDDDAKDNAVMPAVSQALAGERALLGTAKQDNYRVLVACCLADGHNLIAESPLDINIAKQVNILIGDMDFPSDRIVMYPTTGALGYGIEYAYSIQERGRLAALGGDINMAVPVICAVGQEAWRAKEAKATDEEAPGWGSHEARAIAWEVVTATTLLQAGADILVMRHPQAAREVRAYIDELLAE